MSRPIMRLVATATILTALLLGTLPARAVPPSAGTFQRTWARTDQPVANGAASRTWMWGPEAFTGAMPEPYTEGPGGIRTVQYFDKSRMEDNSYRAPDAPWDVTNGLLVVELMTGRMQVGDDDFVQLQPAEVNVAGDPDDPLTYAVLAQRRGDAPLAVGAAVTQRIDSTGAVTTDPGLAGRGVTAATLVDATHHTVASPFWSFMNSSGPVYENGVTTTAPLFQSPYYATGLPITEAYWASVVVGGTPRELLLQCFERRCLTYTPSNPAGWQVEAGNVGQHYYAWRYPPEPPEADITVAEGGTLTLPGQITLTFPPGAVEYDANGTITAGAVPDASAQELVAISNAYTVAIYDALTAEQLDIIASVAVTMTYDPDLVPNGAGAAGDGLQPAPHAVDLTQAAIGWRSAGGGSWQLLTSTVNTQAGTVSAAIAALGQLAVFVPAPPEVEYDVTVEDGGVVLVPGVIRLDFPAGSVSQDTDVLITEYVSTSLPGPNYVSISPQYEITLVGADPAQPVTLNALVDVMLRYDVALIPSGRTEADAQLWQRDEQTLIWSQLQTLVDAPSDMVRGSIGDLRRLGAFVPQPVGPQYDVTVAEGGVVSLPGEITLEFPPGAVSQDTNVTITAGPSGGGADYVSVSSAYTFTFQGADPGQPVELLAPYTAHIRFDQWFVPTETPHSALSAAWLDAQTNTWQLVGGTVDTVQHVVSATFGEVAPLAVFAPEPEYDTAGAQVSDATGGVVEIPGEVILTIPAGALGQDATVTITESAPVTDLPSGAIPVSNAYFIAIVDELGYPIQLVSNVELCIFYDTSRLPDGESEEYVGAARYDASLDEWQAVPSVIDTANDNVSASVLEFSRWTLFF